MDLLQGQNATFYLTFLDSFNVPITSGISGTTIDIYHFANSSLVIDVSGASMTQQNAPYSQVWEYPYVVPQNALVTSYNVVYNALFSGNSIQSTEVFNVFPSESNFPNAFGQGSVTVSGSVVNQSGVGIAGAMVTVSSGMTILAGVNTDVSGNYVVFLNPGVDLFTFQATGYFINQQTETIPTLVTNFNIGPVALMQNYEGSLTISDQYAYKLPSQQVVPIPNLKVRLYANDNPAGDPPLSIAYTDVSGTWIMKANPGHYVLTVEGEVWDVTTSRENRFNAIYNIEVDQVWSGTGISGTGFPINFQYSDTSKYNFIGGGY